MVQRRLEYHSLLCYFHSEFIDLLLSYFIHTKKYPSNELGVPCYNKLSVLLDSQQLSYFMLLFHGEECRTSK